MPSKDPSISSLVITTASTVLDTSVMKELGLLTPRVVLSLRSLGAYCTVIATVKRRVATATGSLLKDSNWS